jgi:hypothetical protein
MSPLTTSSPIKVYAIRNFRLVLATMLVIICLAPIVYILVAVVAVLLAPKGKRGKEHAS